MPKSWRCIHRPLAGGVKLGPDGDANTTFALQLRDSSGPAAKRPQSSHRGLSPAPRFTGPGETARRPRGLLPAPASPPLREDRRSEEHTSELQSLMRISYAVFCVQKKKIP